MDGLKALDPVAYIRFASVYKDFSDAGDFARLPKRWRRKRSRRDRQAARQIAVTFWAYMLRCSDGSYYAGHTEALEARIGAHQSVLFAGYTQIRRPVDARVVPGILQIATTAFAAERQIKGWTRAKKEAFIRGDWDGVPSAGHAYTVLRDAVFDKLSRLTQDERVGNKSRSS